MEAVVHSHAPQHPSMRFLRSRCPSATATSSNVQDPSTESASVSPDPGATPTLAYVRAQPDHSQTISCSDDTDGKETVALFSKETALLYLRSYGVLVIYSSVAFLLVLLLLHLSFFAAKMDDGSGAEPEFIGCRSWAFDDNCGLGGIDCRPFESDWSAFRCPTKCNIGSVILTIRFYSCSRW